MSAKNLPAELPGYGLVFVHMIIKFETFTDMCSKNIA